MVQTSTKRRNIIFAAAAIVVLVVFFSCGLIVFYQSSTFILALAKLDVIVFMDHASVLQGSNLKAEVNVTTTRNPQNVTLGAVVNSSGIQCNLEPTFGKSSFTSLLTINVPDSTPSGNYTVTLTASSGAVTQNSFYNISVLSANVTVAGRVTLHSAADWYFLNSIHFEDTQTKTTQTYTFSIPRSR